LVARILMNKPRWPISRRFRPCLAPRHHALDFTDSNITLYSSIYLSDLDSGFGLALFLLCIILIVKCQVGH